MSETRQPKPGEVWEAADGSERRFVYRAGPVHVWYCSIRGDAAVQIRVDEWLGWLTRTGARCILEARA